MKMCQYIIYFFFYLVSPIQIYSNERQPGSPQHTTFFFVLSYLKPTHVTSFKSTLSFSVHSYAGITKKSAISKIIIISSLILQSQLTILFVLELIALVGFFSAGRVH